jgi:hypothetical protein
MKSIFEARAHLKAMSAEDRAIISSRKCEGEMPPTEWLRLIDRLDAFDARAQHARGVARSGFWICLAGAIVAVIFGSSSGMSWLFAFAGIAGLLAFVFFLPSWMWLGSVDVPDSLRSFVAPMIAVLREDMKTGGTLKCRFDFTDWDTTPKRLKSVEVPKSELLAGTQKRTNNYYRNGWIMVEGALVDGSRLKFEITDYRTVAKIRKRGRSGKIKFKTKSKLKRVSRVTMRPGPGIGIASVPESTPSAFEVISRPGGSVAIRSEAIEEFPPVAAVKTPDPEMDGFLVLAGRAIGGLTRNASA